MHVSCSLFLATRFAAIGWRIGMHCQRCQVIARITYNIIDSRQNQKFTYCFKRITIPFLISSFLFHFVWTFFAGRLYLSRLGLARQERSLHKWICYAFFLQRCRRDFKETHQQFQHLVTTLNLCSLRWKTVDSCFLKERKKLIGISIFQCWAHAEFNSNTSFWERQGKERDTQRQKERERGR